jgi:uncharacterized membrane protein
VILSLKFLVILGKLAAAMVANFGEAVNYRTVVDIQIKKFASRTEAIICNVVVLFFRCKKTNKNKKTEQAEKTNCNVKLNQVESWSVSLPFLLNFAICFFYLENQVCSKRAVC